jgi:hypothetical protein
MSMLDEKMRWNFGLGVVSIPPTDGDVSFSYSSSVTDKSVGKIEE